MCIRPSSSTRSRKHTRTRYPGVVVRVVLAIAALASVSLLVGETSAAAANVRGTVTRGPISPVCIAERPCERPAPGVVLVFSRGGSDVKRVTTGARGGFGLRLPPGVYVVRTLGRPTFGNRLAPVRFRVPSSGAVVLRLSIDTGIR